MEWLAAAKRRGVLEKQPSNNAKLFGRESFTADVTGNQFPIQIRQGPAKLLFRPTL